MNNLVCLSYSLTRELLCLKTVDLHMASVLTTDLEFIKKQGNRK